MSSCVSRVPFITMFLGRSLRSFSFVSIFPVRNHRTESLDERVAQPVIYLTVKDISYRCSKCKNFHDFNKIYEELAGSSRFVESLDFTGIDSGIFQSCRLRLEIRYRRKRILNTCISLFEKLGSNRSIVRCIDKFRYSVALYLTLIIRFGWHIFDLSKDETRLQRTAPFTSMYSNIGSSKGRRQKSA